MAWFDVYWAGGQLKVVRFPGGSKRVTEASHYSQLHSINKHSTLSTMATQFYQENTLPENRVFSITVQRIELQWAVEMAKLWCNMSKISSAHSQRSSEGQQCGRAQRIPCTQLFPFQQPSAHQKPLWSARGVWGHRGRWEPELRTSDEGTLCLLSLSQVSALVARHGTHPDESTPETLGLRRSCFLGRGTHGLGCLSGTPNQLYLCVWGSAPPNYGPEGSNVRCMKLVRLGSRGSCWAEFPSPAAGGMCTDVCICTLSLVHFCTVQPGGWEGWGCWCCGCSLCLSLLSVLQQCVSIHVVINAPCPSRGYLLSLSAGGTPSTELPQPHLSWTVRPCTICCIKSRVSLGEVYKYGWYSVSSFLISFLLWVEW